MKKKIFSLAFMVIFAIVATSLVSNFATHQMAKASIDFTVCYSDMHVSGKAFVVPLGDPIDSPGGPTITPGP